MATYKAKDVKTVFQAVIDGNVTDEIVTIATAALAPSEKSVANFEIGKEFIDGKKTVSIKEFSEILAEREEIDLDDKDSMKSIRGKALQIMMTLVRNGFVEKVADSSPAVYTVL